MISHQQTTLPSKASKLREDFDITSDEDLQEVYTLPHEITQETYLKSLQYKVLNYRKPPIISPPPKISPPENKPPKIVTKKPSNYKPPEYKPMGAF